MASAPRLALGFLLSLLGVCVEGNCPTFLSAKDQNFSCPPSCVQPSRSGNDPVFGTEYYNASSDVCLSALHAGVVGLSGGNVQFRNVGESPINGSMINRVVSRSGEPAVAYAFIKENLPLDFSEADLTEKVLVHNSYFKDNLHLSCVAERSNVVLDEGNIARLEYGNYKGEANVFRKYHPQVLFSLSALPLSHCPPLLFPLSPSAFFHISLLTFYIIITIMDIFVKGRCRGD
ncbi:uncharacterized protein LOC134768506 [Penaeus indicus]|uniref:uncharacterized protein LOC134768506 n=1 Tax=Penaeus indicus TaxID=29960 RepID=UPI00300C7DE7